MHNQTFETVSYHTISDDSSCVQAKQNGMVSHGGSRGTSRSSLLPLLPLRDTSSADRLCIRKGKGFTQRTRGPEDHARFLWSSGPLVLWVRTNLFDRMHSQSAETVSRRTRSRGEAWCPLRGSASFR